MAETSRSRSDSIEEEEYKSDYEKYDGLCQKKYGSSLGRVDGKKGYDCVACINNEGKEVDFADLEKKDSTPGDEGDGKKKKDRSKSPRVETPPAAPEPPPADEPTGEDKRSSSLSLEELKKEMLAEYEEQFAECMGFFDEELYSSIDDESKKVIKNIKVKAFEKIRKSITTAEEKTNKIFNRKETMKKYQEIIGKTMQDLNEAFEALNESTSEGGTRRSYRKKKRTMKRKKRFWFF